MRRIKLVLTVVALLTMLMAVSAAPAMADGDIDRECFPFCDNHDDDGDEIDDVDVEGPFLVGDDICVFVVTEFEDDDVDVDRECVDLF